jgi:TRAP transporter TAXI family solute receptor
MRPHNEPKKTNWEVHQKMKHYALTGLIAASLALPMQASAQDGASYILSTASTGGTYYPVGVAIATLTKVRLEPSTGIGMSAISSAGSGENVRLLREGEAQFGILQGLFGYYAATGTGPVEADGPQEHLRSVSLLWPNVEHFILANEHVESGTFSDFLSIQGMGAALGRQNSGTIGSNAAILANFGIDDLRKQLRAGFRGLRPLRRGTAERPGCGHLHACGRPRRRGVAAYGSRRR